jgi:hypothetical protein
MGIFFISPMLLLICFHMNNWRWNHTVGRNSSVGITTSYRLDGPGSNPGGGGYFTPIQAVPGAHQASYRMGTGSFLVVNRPGCHINHPPLSSAEVSVRVELYLYSPSGPSWPLLGQNYLYFL